MSRTKAVLVVVSLLGLHAPHAASGQEFVGKEIFAAYGDSLYETGLTMGRLAEAFRNNHAGNEARWVGRGADEQVLRVINVDPLTKERRKMAFLFFVGSQGAVVRRLVVDMHEASEREIFVTMMEIAATLRAREQGARPAPWSHDAP